MTVKESMAGILVVLLGLGLLHSEWWRANAEAAYYTSAVLAAIGALWIYRRNSLLEQAKWALQLYEKFYEAGNYKQIRDALDCDPDSLDVNRLVEREDPQFTDYLNFFELVAFLAESGQLTNQQVETLFSYYLKNLKKHASVQNYVNDQRKGFEKLRKLLSRY